MKQERTQNDQRAAGERIAKVIARAGLGSRREAEAWIGQGRVAVNGEVVGSPARNVGAQDRITVDGKPLPARERTRLFLYHKPRGLVTTRVAPQGRPTIFAALPAGLPRLISVGRLDLNTEGLLLLTNDGGLARVLELPATGWLRRYRVRAHGRTRQEDLDRLRDGVTIDGVRYGPIEAALDRAQGSNVWLTFAMREGKNREVKNVLGHLGLAVNRLIRLSFGPFQLGDLAAGAIEEVRTRTLREQLGPRIAALAGADFSAPIEHRDPIVRAYPVGMESAPHFVRPRASGDPEPHAPSRRPLGSRLGGNERQQAPIDRPRSARKLQDDGTAAGKRHPHRTRRKSMRNEAERLGQPELARREKRRGRKAYRGPAPGRAHKPPRGKGR